MHRLCLVLLFIVQIVIVHAVYALNIDDLYVVQIKNNSTVINSEQKNDLIKDEFIKLLYKITGKNIQLSMIGIEGIENIDKYINKYEYQDQTTLKVYFDKYLINNVLTEYGYSFLQDRMPTTIIWPKSSNLIASDLSNTMFKEISIAAKERGLPIIYPVMDLKEVEALHKNQEQTIKQIKELSNKYEVDEILIADFQEWGNKLNVNCKSIVNNWQFKDSIINTSNDYIRFVNLFLDQLLENFLKIYTKNNLTKSKEVLLINVSNVISLEDYVNVEQYLQNLSMISSLKAIKFQAGEVEFEATLSGSKEAIKNLIESNKLLKEVNKKSSIHHDDDDSYTETRDDNKLFYTLYFA